MNTNILSKDKDPMGAAILDYQTSGKAGRLRVLSSMFEEDEMPVKHLFRTYKEMPLLEQIALTQAKGRVLDVGAGAGCHALALQDCIKAQELFGDSQMINKITSVKAIDISPLSLRGDATERREGCGMHQSLRRASERWQQSSGRCTPR